MKPETREKLREAGRKSWEKRRAAAPGNQTVEASSSESRPSSDSPKPSTAVEPLPPRASSYRAEKPRLSRSEAEEVLERLLLKATSEGKTTEEEPPKKKRRIPSDPARRKRKLSFAYIPARVPVNLLNELARAFSPTNPLDAREREELLEAWAALFWYYGLTHPLAVCALVTLGVIIPRTVDWLEDRRRVAKGLKPLDRSADGTALAAKELEAMKKRVAELEQLLSAASSESKGNGLDHLPA